MAGRGVADVVFCLDTSASMRPCIEAVKKHITDFVRGLESSGQGSWDVRMDFLAHAASEQKDKTTLFRMKSLRSESVVDTLYRQGGMASFFTSKVSEFQEGLAKLEVSGDEATLIALDTALDYPWRPRADCHRVVVCLTDEPIEAGLWVQQQQEILPRLIEKVQRMRVLLFIVAPESAAFNQLSAVDKCEYEVIGDEQQNRGLTGVDFSLLLSHVGKSVSVSQPGQSPAPVPSGPVEGLFAQHKWGTGSGEMTGA